MKYKQSSLVIQLFRPPTMRQLKRVFNQNSPAAQPLLHTAFVCACVCIRPSPHTSLFWRGESFEGGEINFPRVSKHK